MRRTLPLLLLLVTTLPLGTHCGRGGDQSQIIISKNIQYNNGPDADKKKHLLDVYAPAAARGKPVILFVHGGSWRMGDKSRWPWRYDIIGKRFARQGVVFVVISYRLAPEAKYDDQARDVARAVGWASRNVNRFGGAPNKIFLMGHSAGAHLVALVTLDRRYLKDAGVNAAAIKGVIGISGPYDITRAYAEAPWFSRRFQLEPAFGKDPRRYATASPINYVSSQAPPFLLFYAQHEQRYFGDVATDFGRALRRRGVPAVVRQLRGKTHITEVWTLGSSRDGATLLILDWIRRSA